MNKIIDPYALGATLFIPANHKDLTAILIRQKLPTLRSIVIDTEDGLSEESLDESVTRLKFLFETLIKSDLIIFFRARNIELLKEILYFKGSEKIDGFILPKFSLSNAQEYLDIFRSNSTLNFMPSIEGEELFNVLKLQELRDLILPLQKQIILIRFGAQDMFSKLALKRSCEDTLYDLTSSTLVIANLITTFKPFGFQLSAAVYPCFKNDVVLKLESALDVKNGLISKTIIHPNQIEIIEESYQVANDEYQMALKILKSTDTIGSSKSIMIESHTDSNWAKTIIKRHEYYGLKV